MKTEKKLVIVGAGETGRLAFEYFRCDSEYEVVAFAIEGIFIKESLFCGLPVVPLEELNSLFPPESHYAFVAMGSAKLNRQRKMFYLRVRDAGYRCASYVSSRATIWHNAQIGENCFILEGNNLQPFTKVGNNVVMWSGNHLGHQSSIGDHCFITSHVVISGFCEIGEHTFIGVNATVVDQVKVSEDNFICAGALVTQDTECDQIYKASSAVLASMAARRYCRVKESL